METNHTMTHASLFSGIGGAEIAAAWMGWDNLFHCELNPFGRKVLEYWFPNAKSYGDITKTDFTPWRGQIDVLTAGFPCQPFSLAGQRRGAEDDRYLWPQVMRVVRETRPAWVVGENVAGILTMVQPGCEADVASQATLFGEDNLCRTEQQYVIETICQDLESAGYSVQPFDIPACAVGAPHRRDRVWIVAHRSDAGAETLQCGWQDGVHAVGIAPDTHGHGGQAEAEWRPKQAKETIEQSESIFRSGVTSDTDLDRWWEREGEQEPFSERQGKADNRPDGNNGTAPDTDCHRSAPRTQGAGVETGGRGNLPQPGERRDAAKRAGGLHGLPRIAYNPFRFGRDKGGLHHGRAEKEQGECEFEPADCPQNRWRNFSTQSPVCNRDDGLSLGLAGITFPRWRAEAVKALGNAWVPQVAYEIFRAIEAANAEFEI